MNINVNLTPYNHSSGRAGQDIAGIVLHTMVGTIDSAESRFFNPNSSASSNYGIGLDGEVRQWVREEDTSYCNGNWNSNLTTITIEHADNGDYNGERTPELYDTSIELVADICRRYGIPCDRDHIKRHNEVIDLRYYPGGTACPDSLDVDRIVNEANNLINPPAPETPIPVAVPDQAPATATSTYTRLATPLTLKANKQPTNVYNLDAGSWATLNVAVVKELNQGDPFVAVGKAQHPLGGVYYMTAYSFGNADTTGTPDHNYGVNTVDLTLETPPAVTVETPVAEAAPATPTDNGEIIPVKVIPVAPDAWKASFKINAAGDYVSKESLVIKDLDAIHPDLELPKGQNVNIVGTFAKDGNNYYKPKLKTFGEDHWYGIPFDQLVEDDSLFDPKFVDQLRQEFGNFTKHEKNIRLFARITAFFNSVLNVFKRKK